MRNLHALPLFVLASTASAHSSAASSGFFEGLVHPISGADHVLAMVAVGLLAAPSGRRGLWVPATFMTAMIVGGLAGVAELPLPFVEQGIALSVLGLGLLLAFAQPLRLPALAALGGVMGLFHGHAHGAELPASASALEFFVGFACSTAALHLAGFGLGAWVARPGAKTRPALGAGMALMGTWLLLG